jgi:hypothetical protein
MNECPSFLDEECFLTAMSPFTSDFVASRY